LKVLYALVLVLSAFAAPAQTLDASTITVCDLDDCCFEVIEQSMMPASPVASEPTIVTLEETDAAAIARPDDAEGDFAVGTIQSSDETWTVQDTMPARIVATEPTIAGVRDGAVDEGDGVTITIATDPEDVPAGAIEPSGETQTVAGTMPAQIVTTEPTIATVGDDVDEADGVTKMLASDPAIDRLAEAVDEAEGIGNERAPSILD
jgi:hypothetical protein